MTDLLLLAVRKVPLTLPLFTGVLEVNVFNCVDVITCEAALCKFLAWEAAMGITGLTNDFCFSFGVIDIEYLLSASHHGQYAIPRLYICVLFTEQVIRLFS